MQKLKNKHLVSIADLDKEEILTIFNVAKDLKAKQKKGDKHHILEGKTLAMIFEKPSTRTRVSFETGIYQLGGIGLYLSSNDLQLGRGETIADTSRVMSRYVDGIMARTFAHETVLELAKHGSIPVINGLTDLLHPCQILTDYFSVLEKKKALAGLRVTYLGDGNNVCNSLINGAAKLGINLYIACPKGYEPNNDIVNKAREISKSEIKIGYDPKEMSKDADVLYTDVWASMGQDNEYKERKKLMQHLQLNSEIISLAKPDCLVMHDLPAHRGDEITDDVMDGPNSIIFDQAENRLHVQKAVMALLMG